MAIAVTAVFDVGKTNLKLLAVDESGRVLWQRTTPNRTLPGPPYGHHDVAGAERWLLAGLRELAAEHKVAALVTTAHGGTGVLVDDVGPVLPVADYEDAPPAWLDAAYAEVMPGYLERGSAVMGSMSHIGRQLFRLQKEWPDAVARAEAVLMLPQYWAWRLSGVRAAEITSLAAQSHLWDVLHGRPSSLVAAMGWERLLPPLRPAWEALGPITAAVAAATGLDPATPVINGIHDSSGNFYRYQCAGLGDAALMSTGTWMVGLRAALKPGELVERRTMTLNADVHGRPVGGVLAMAGREVGILAAGDPGPVPREAVAAVIAAGTLVRPSLAVMDGPFPGSAGRGRVIGPDVPGRALGITYAALVTEFCLELMRAEGRVVIDGGFATEPLFAALVAALRPDLEVLVEPVGGGTALGAALLATHNQGEAVPPPPLRLMRARPIDLPGGALDRHRARWRDLLEQPPGTSRNNGRVP